MKVSTGLAAGANNVNIYQIAAAYAQGFVAVALALNISVVTVLPNININLGKL
jgi:hypothetical protein